MKNYVAFDITGSTPKYCQHEKRKCRYFDVVIPHCHLFVVDLDGSYRRLTDCKLAERLFKRVVKK